MDKEKFFTIGIGLAVGILAASTYFTVTKILPNIGKKNPMEIIQFKREASTKPTTPPTVSKTQLSLDLPIENSSTKDPTATVSGQTTANATIIVFSNATEKIASADAAGKFNSSIKLDDGLNMISVTALDGINEPNVIYRNVTLEILQ